GLAHRVESNAVRARASSSCAASSASTWWSSTVPCPPSGAPSVAVVSVPAESASRSSNAERSSSTSGPAGSAGPGRGAGDEAGMVTSSTLVDDEPGAGEPGPDRRIARGERRRSVAPRLADHASGEAGAVEAVRERVQGHGRAADLDLEV